MRWWSADWHGPARSVDCNWRTWWSTLRGPICGSARKPPKAAIRAACSPAWFSSSARKIITSTALGTRVASKLAVLGSISKGIASASSSSAWTLLGVSGAAYAWGLSAIWLFPACVGGFILNWYVLARRLRDDSHERGTVTVTEVVAGHDALEDALEHAVLSVL